MCRRQTWNSLQSPCQRDGVALARERCGFSVRNGSTATVLPRHSPSERNVTSSASAHAPPTRRLQHRWGVAIARVPCVSHPRVPHACPTLGKRDSALRRHRCVRMPARCHNGSACARSQPLSRRLRHTFSHRVCEQRRRPLSHLQRREDQTVEVVTRANLQRRLSGRPSRSAPHIRGALPDGRS